MDEFVLMISCDVTELKIRNILYEHILEKSFPTAVHVVNKVEHLWRIGQIINKYESCYAKISARTYLSSYKQFNLR